MKRALSRILPKIGLWTLLQVTLLLAALSCVVFGLAGVTRDLDVGLLLSMAAMGALLSWLAARTRLRAPLAALLALLWGVAFLLVRVGRLEGDLFAVWRGAAMTVWQVARWAFADPRPAHLFSGPLPDWRLVPLALTQLTTDVATLVGRASDWLQALRVGQPAFDPAAAALVWGMALWLVSVWAAWLVRRYRQPILGLLPAGALLTYNLYYTGARPYILLLFLGAALLLTALSLHEAREQRWLLGRVDFSPDIWKSLIETVTLITAGLVLIALLVPAFSVRDVARFFQQLGGTERSDRELVAKSLGLEPRPPTVDPAFVRAGTTGLPRGYLVGSPPELLRQVVMVVRTDDMRPNVAEPPLEHYWRTHTYDRYTGSGWATSETTVLEYPAGQTIISPTLPYYRLLEQEVQLLGETGGLLPLAGEPVWVDQDVRVAWRSVEDLFAVSSEERLYRAQSLVPLVSQAELRAAGSDYPAWVRARYLELPETLPERVRTLARDLTATAPTPYERALAIEGYLRAFPYSLDVPQPPPDRDVADFFLFDLRRGYCDYYATAMVVLARAAGLPARLVVGYASGTYEADEARFVVVGANAHAWAEVYFPGYGWIEFEPTGNRPPFERPQALGPLEWPEAPVTPAPPAGGRRTSGWCWGALAVLAALPLAVGGWLAVDGLRLRLLPPLTAVTILYRRLRRWGRRLGVAMRAGDTACEFGAELSDQTADVSEDIGSLVGLYVAAHYGPTLPARERFRGVVRGWGRLRWRLGLALLRCWLARLEPRRRLPYPR